MRLVREWLAPCGFGLTVFLGLALLGMALDSRAGPPEVVKVPRLVPIGDLGAGAYFCEELNDDVWATAFAPGNPDDYPASNYYGVGQPPKELANVYAVNLTTGKLYLWRRDLKVRPVIDCRVVARIHAP